MQKETSMLTDLQKGAVQAIVNVFETGAPLGDYASVTLLRGDTGHLTYGRSQTTLASGNLYLLIKDYVDTDDAAFATALRPYLSRLDAIDLSLDEDSDFHAILRSAGDDPVMQRIQDAFFDRVFWAPAVRSAAYIDSAMALGMAVIYDSRIHGSWHAIRDRVIKEYGPLSDLGEKTWMWRYVAYRKDWLATHSNTLLRKTVYRMDSMQTLMGSEKWDLSLPFSVRGITIDRSVLTGGPAVRVFADETPLRLLRLRKPPMRGDDVHAVQESLSTFDKAVRADGVFGRKTKDAVTRFQKKYGLAPDGIVGPATLAALKIGL
jgi:chitosanase